MKGLHAILILGIIILIGVNIFFIWISSNQTVIIPEQQTGKIKNQEPENESNLIEISTSCNSDSDCSWQIINCCSENAGGQWQCISKESKIECNELILCPQVLSPKPQETCGCEQSRCSSE